MSSRSSTLPRSFSFAALVVLATLAPAAPAHADMYKCLGDNSSPVYQETPCPSGRELRNFQTDPATVSVVPFDLTPPSAPPATGTKKAGKRDNAAGERPPESKSTRARAKPAIPPGNAVERKFLHAGMSEAEVLARIGAPDMKSGNAGRRGGARWSYLPSDGDPGMITTLHFQSGEVTQIDRKPVR